MPTAAGLVLQFMRAQLTTKVKPLEENRVVEKRYCPTTWAVSHVALLDLKHCCLCPTLTGQSIFGCLLLSFVRRHSILLDSAYRAFLPANPDTGKSPYRKRVPDNRNEDMMLVVCLSTNDDYPLSYQRIQQFCWLNCRNA